MASKTGRGHVGISRECSSPRPLTEMVSSGVRGVPQCERFLHRYSRGRINAVDCNRPASAVSAAEERMIVADVASRKISLAKISMKRRTCL